MKRLKEYHSSDKYETVVKPVGRRREMWYRGSTGITHSKVVSSDDQRSYVNYEDGVERVEQNVSKDMRLTIGIILTSIWMEIRAVLRMNLETFVWQKAMK